MARRDLEPEERDVVPLNFTSLHDCPNPDCRETMEVDFVQEGVYEFEDIVGELATVAKCPKCGTEFDATYTGWTVHDEA